MRNLIALFAMATLAACAHREPVNEPVIAPAPQAEAAPVAPPPPAAGFHGPEDDIAIWNTRHPEAARELCSWVSTHREAAHKFFEWDANHPERSQEFVNWTLYHPREGIDAFVASHQNWPGFDRISENHRPAAMAFMDWVRRFPAAAQKLMSHRAGLAWAGDHLGC
jgi:hypothetical protein